MAASSPGISRFRWGMSAVLTISMVSVIALLITTLTVLDIRRERAIFNSELEERGLLMAETLNDVLADPVYFSDIDGVRDIVEVVWGQPDIAYVRIFRPDGRLLVDGPRLDDQADYPVGFVTDGVGLSAAQHVQTRLRFLGDRLEVASPIEVGPQVLGVVQFGFSADSLNAEIRAIILQHVWQGLFLVVIGLFLAYLIARFATRHLKTLTSAAEEIGGGNLDSPISARGPREFAVLAHALERMRVELRGLYGGLEQQVAERTKQLRDANEELVREIDQRKRIEDELHKAWDVALEASRAKSDFLSSMSHEIRTPLNVITGMADLLAETPLNPEQGEYVRVTRAAGENLLHLINDVLDLAKIEADQLSLEEVQFDLVELIDNRSQLLAVQAHEKGIELSCHIRPDVPRDLVGDPVRMGQVITNLIGNAIKFTEECGVELHVETDPAASVPGCLLFQVSDTGIGIPENKLDSIFGMFTHADSNATRRYGGTGLGLSICRRLVALMGGRMWVESEVGHGSSFYFTARLAVRPSADPARASRPTDLAGLKTLVVDDNATNRLILMEMLGTWGALATEAEDGHQALAEFERAKKAAAPYQLILLDHRMSGMDGLQVAEQLKAYLGTVNMAIVMLTSDALSVDIARFQGLGISRYLVKPVARSDLYRAISEVVGLAGPGDGDTLFVDTPSSTDKRRALSILLAEDSPDNRMVVEAYLKNTQHRIDVADNGEIAVAKFKSGDYDLVLMDIQMPVMDGYTATKEIRIWEEENGLSPTPIVALTASVFLEARERSLAAGCTAHISKPVKKATLIETIYEHV